MLNTISKASLFVVVAFYCCYNVDVYSKQIVADKLDQKTDLTLTVTPPTDHGPTKQHHIPPIRPAVTNNSKSYTFPRGQAYLNLCRNKGVPIPPNFSTNSWTKFGSKKWQSHGILDTTFIQKERDAEVYTYISRSPEGMCYALPRYNEKDEAIIFAVICHGKQSSNACFWDIDHNGPKPKRGQSVQILDLLSPADLEEKCTSCHAGQNPYIVHPNTLLDQPDRDTNHWYKPIVPSNWPQNPGPANAPSACAGCHKKNGIGGSLPAVSLELENYCEFVLKPALNRTMPPGAPGSLVSEPEVQNYLDLCSKSPSAAHAQLHIANGSGFTTSSVPVQLQDFDNKQRWLSGDFNGDGVHDLVSIYGESQADGKQKATSSIYIGTGSGFEQEPKITRFAGFWESQRWLVGDFNGDGKDDLVNIYGKDNSGSGQTARAWVHLSTGTSFEYNSNFTILAGFWKSQRWLVGDFDGDGKDDLVNIYGKDNPDGSQTARAWVHRSTGTGFEDSSFTTFAGFSENQRWITGDFNGDGMDDLVNVYGKKQAAGLPKSRAWVHLSTGIGFDYQSSFTELADFHHKQHWLAANFDGDRNNDLVNVHGIKPRYDQPLKARSWVHSSTSDGFEYKSSLTLFPDEFKLTDDQHWLTGDFNGDGTDDLVNVFSKGRHD